VGWTRLSARGGPTCDAVTAYAGEPLRAPVDPAVVVLAARAVDGHLVVCAGAGLSVAPDAELPSGLKSGTVRGYIRSGRLPGRYDGDPTWRGWVTTRGAVEAYRAKRG
jgi:hypothetical protein